MATKDQVQRVLDNPAFKEAVGSLEEDYTSAILIAKDKDEAWGKRLKYDALIEFLAEFERKLNEIGE